MRVAFLALLGLMLAGCPDGNDPAPEDAAVGAPDAVVETDAGPDPDAAADAALDDDLGVEPDGGTDPDAAVDPDGAIEPDAAIEPDGAVEPDMDFDPDAAIELDADLEPDAMEEVDAEVDAEIDAEVDAEIERDAFIPPDPPPACDAPLALPVEAQVELALEDAFAAGDMAFDQFGAMAVVDASGDLYRMNTVGEAVLWAEQVALTPRGIAFLSDGRLVVADSGRGMLIQVYPGGEVRTLVDHLDAPYGLDVDHADQIYVAEATRGGITRVDPDSGALTRLADGLEITPQALALSPDEQTLYISARRSGLVFAMDRDADGVFGPVRGHAALPEAGEEGPGFCGDGRIGGNEQCDDANAEPGDGCDGCVFDPYNGEAAGDVYDMVLDDEGIARVVFTTDFPGEIDRFAFTLDEGGPMTIRTIDLNGDDCAGDTVLALYRAGENDPVAQNDDDPLRQTRFCSRLFPESHAPMADLPAGDYEITVRQYARDRAEPEGNWLIVRTVVPLDLGDACDPGDGALRCPDGSYCGEVDDGDVCIAHVCGDGLLGDDEQCDDGNVLDGDGCDAECAFAPYNGEVDAEDGVYPLEFDALGGARVVYTTDAPADKDHFAFTLDAASDVTIRVSNLAGDGCNGATRLSLYRAGEDQPIVQNEDDPLDELGACSRLLPPEHDAVDDLPAGDYVVVVQQQDERRVEPLGHWLIVQQVPEALAIDDRCEGVEAWMVCPARSRCADGPDGRVCQGFVCGDGQVDEGERCDDGNDIAGDGCGLDCQLDPYNLEVDAAGDVYGLEFDETGTARVIFTTDAPGDEDRFRFRLDEDTAIEILTTDLAGDGCNGDTYVYLYRAGEEEELARNDDDPTQRRRLCSLLRPNEIGALDPLPAGDYEIMVRQFSRQATELIGNWLIVRPPSPVGEQDGPCDGRRPGALCQLDDGDFGRCELDGQDLVCGPEDDEPDGCAERGDACEVDGEPGVCDAGPDGLFCRTGGACGADSAGDPCQSARTGGPGVCVLRDEGVTVCQPTPPCAGRRPGLPCISRNRDGICRDDRRGGAIYCEIAIQGADITALETDACGHIYAGDEVSETIWRISPVGDDVTRFSVLHRGAITGLAFGPESETLFVSGHGGADLLSLEVGVAGRPMVRPIDDDAVPDGPEDPRTFRCLDVPSAPVEINELNRPRGYHDVVFDDQGNIIGWDGTNLVSVDRNDRLVPYALNLARVEGFEFLPDGSLVALTRDGLVRIAPNGAQEVISGDVSGYGLTVGPDGRIYVGNNQNRIWRIDPEVGLVEPYLDGNAWFNGFGPRNIAFDLDASLMYIGTFGPDVFTLTLDERLEPVGEPRYFATVRPNVRWVDGLTTDACGNVYSPNFETATLNRSGPDGGMRIYHQFPSRNYGHNVVFGSGIGGWRTDAIYLPQPYDGNTVVEVVVGVDGAVLEPIEIDPPR